MNNTIKLIATLLIILLGITNKITAQGLIAGRIIDATTNQPLSFATVAVLSADSSVISGTVADESGSFSVNPTQKGSLLSFSFVGYNTVYKKIATPMPKNLEITLSPNTTTLQAVQITAKAPIIEQQMDKLVMNVAQSAFAQGSNAMDLLRKAPGVSVDRDGNVKLNGQIAEVWVDGRPSQLDGKSLEALLQTTDGTTIEKIEVIANPSAKYDAAGQGGIINIKTKRNFLQGLNGSISADGAGMYFNRGLSLTELSNTAQSLFLNQSLSLNLNYRSAKTNTFIQTSEGTSQIGVDVLSETNLNPGGVDFYQLSEARYDARTTTSNLKIGNDWFIDKKNTLGIIFTLPIYSMHQWADSSCNHAFQMVNNVCSQQSMTNAVTDYRFRQYLGNINYTHIFDESKAAEITANLDYMHSINISSNPIENYYLQPSQPLDWSNNSYIQADRMDLDARRIIDVYSAKADWQSLVLGRFMMEAGAKWALSQTNNEMNRTTQDLLLATSPNERIALFDYNEHIGALYATLAGQIATGWTAKIGLRGEYTYAYNSDNAVRQNYFDLFPTIYAGYNTPDMMKRFSYSYTRRIQRPTYMQLNPFQNYIDAHTSNMGNPNLRPSYSDNMSLSAGFGQYVTLTATYMNTHDVIGHTPTIDPATGDQTLWADNIGSNMLWGGSVTLSELPLCKSITLMLSAQLYDFHSIATSSISPIIGAVDNQDEYKARTLFGSGYACLTWNIPMQWKVQLDGYLTSPITQGYLHVGWNYVTNLAIKKSACDGRFQFSLSMNDLLRTLNNNFIVMMNGIEMSKYSQKYLAQTIKVGLTWNFGTAQKPLRQRNVGNLDEAVRTANSTGIK